MTPYTINQLLEIYVSYSGFSPKRPGEILDLTLRFLSPASLLIILGLGTSRQQVDGRVNSMFELVRLAKSWPQAGMSS